MSSYYYGGSIRMNPEVETEDRILPDHYPYQLPKVYIEGKGKRNHKWTQYDWGDDSVVEIRDKHIARYTRTAFAEMLVENKRGESVWVNSKNAASFPWFDEENIKDIRGAFEYKVEEYDLEKFEKRTYKVLLDETSTFCVDDYYAPKKLNTFWVHIVYVQLKFFFYFFINSFQHEFRNDLSVILISQKTISKISVLQQKKIFNAYSLSCSKFQMHLLTSKMLKCKQHSH